MCVLFHYAAGPELQRRLAAPADQGFEIDICPEADDRLLGELIGEVDVLWHVLSPVTADLIAAAPRLRLIQKIGVGVNTIDLDTARDRGIAVCNLPGTNSRAVAEMTLALMLSVLRRLQTYDQAVRRGEGWSLDPRIQDDLGEVGGRTVGLVGYGAVAKVLAPILSVLGVRVLYTAREPKPDAEADWREFEALLAESDIVSLHVPQTEQTELMIDAQALARMKAGSILINTARGGLVDEAALVALSWRGVSAGLAWMSFRANRSPRATRCCVSRTLSSLRTFPGSQARRSIAASPWRSRTAGDSRPGEPLLNRVV